MIPARTMIASLLLLSACSGSAAVSARASTGPVVSARRADPTILAISTSGAQLGQAGGTVGSGEAALSAGAELVIKVEASAKGSQSFESAILGGLADFVVNRASIEVRGYVTRTFGKEICASDDGGWNVRSYFEETCGLFADAERQLEVRDLGPAFRTALATDLTRLLPVVLNAGLAHVLPEQLESHLGVANAVIQVVRAVRSGENPLAAIAIATSDVPCDGEDLDCAIHGIGLGLRALLTSSTGDELAFGRIAIEDRERFVEEAEQRLALILADAAPAAVSMLSPDKRKKLLLRLMSAASAIQIIAQGSYERDELVRMAFDLVRAGVEVLGTEEHAVAEFKNLTHVWYEIEEWVGVGRAVLAIIEGVWSGEDPIALSIAATRILPCMRADDVGCALRAVGLTVREVQKQLAVAKKEVEGTAAIARECRDVNEIPSVLATYVDVLDIELGKVVDEIGRTASTGSPQRNLHDWYMRYLDRRAGNRRELISKVLHGVCRTHGLLAENRALPGYQLEQRRALAMEILDSTLGIWRGAMAATVPPSKHERALAILDNIYSARVAVARRDIGGFVVAVRAVARNLRVRTPFPTVVERYMPLMVDLVAAKDAGDVTAALEKYAEPAGGWQRKRERGWGTSLTAYLGVGVGIEHTASLGRAGELAGFAPLGVEVSRYSVGALVSILDIGTLTAVRLNGEQALPDAQFRSVLSPGLYLRWSPVNSPFIIGAGASTVPGLRGDDSEVAWRALVFGAVDITIFSL